MTSANRILLTTLAGGSDSRVVAAWHVLHGIAVGVDEDGDLTVFFAGLETLTPPQRRALAERLSTLSLSIEQGQLWCLQ